MNDTQIHDRPVTRKAASSNGSVDNGRHLQQTDARGRGQDPSAAIAFDIDGKPRSAGPDRDVGADQVAPLVACGLESGDLTA